MFFVIGLVQAAPFGYCGDYTLSQFFYDYASVHRAGLDALAAAVAFVPVYLNNFSYHKSSLKILAFRLDLIIRLYYYQSNKSVVNTTNEGAMKQYFDIIGRSRLFSGISPQHTG